MNCVCVPVLNSKCFYLYQKRYLIGEGKLSDQVSLILVQLFFSDFVQLFLSWFVYYLPIQHNNNQIEAKYMKCRKVFMFIVKKGALKGVNGMASSFPTINSFNITKSPCIIASYNIQFDVLNHGFIKHNIHVHALHVRQNMTQKFLMVKRRRSERSK